MENTNENLIAKHLHLEAMTDMLGQSHSLAQQLVQKFPRKANLSWTVLEVVSVQYYFVALQWCPVFVICFFVALYDHWWRTSMPVDVIYLKSFIVYCRFILSYYTIISLLYRVGLFLIPTSYAAARNEPRPMIVRIKSWAFNRTKLSGSLFGPIRYRLRAGQMQTGP